MEEIKTVLKVIIAIGAVWYLLKFCFGCKSTEEKLVAFMYFVIYQLILMGME